MRPTMTAETIYVAPLSLVATTVADARVSHLVTLINGETLIDTPASIDRDRHLRLAMNGISKAHASKSLHRCRASASEPETKKLVDAVFTFSMNARIESSMLAVSASDGLARQAMITTRYNRIRGISTRRALI